MKHGIHKIDLTYAMMRVLTDDYEECSERPDDNHILTSNWQDSPMDPAICWEPKSQLQIDTEKDARAIGLDDTKKAFFAVLELLWDTIPEIQTVYPDPGGKAAFKQAAVAAYRAKL